MDVSPRADRPRLRIEFDEFAPPREITETCLVCGRVDRITVWSPDDTPRPDPPICYECLDRRRPAGASWRDQTTIARLSAIAAALGREATCRTP
jgi:hypothetical protein